jgi:hypothetical protein
MKKLLFAISMFAVSFTFAQSSKKVDPSNVSINLTTFDTIKLLAPDTLGGKPLMQTISRRKTDR